MFLFCSLTSIAQTVSSQINSRTYENSRTSYNYAYWDESFKNSSVSEYRFKNQTESYLLSVDYNDLSIHSLDINTQDLSPEEAYLERDATIFSNLKSGDIDYAILRNGEIIHQKTTTPTNYHSNGVSMTQLPEFGKWCNRRMVDNLNFTNNAQTEGNFTGIEFTNWHDRFKITFRLRPTTTIISGQMQLSIEMPAAFSTKYGNGSMYAFSDGSGKGFSLKPGVTSGSTTITGNTITITTDQTNLIAGTSYDISLVFYPITENIAEVYDEVSDKEQEVTITAVQSLPYTDQTTVVYNEDEGVHFIDVPGHVMGYRRCDTEEVLQDIDLSVSNTSNIEKTVRICFQQFPAANVVGFVSMIRNDNGDPSGHHLQISKNWHGSYDGHLYGGSQSKEYTEIIVPANSTINFDYTRIGAKWGETYAAFSHQLSVVGHVTFSGSQWLEAGLGSFGENLCHSPEYFIGNTNVTDWRPFLTTNQSYGGTSVECNWTGNVGGMDLANYHVSGQKNYQSEVKTKFHKYGPNLAETSVSFYSSDKKIRTTYTFFMNRSDDMNRAYYKVKVDALGTTSFDRYDFFQLGGDSYRYYYTNKVAYGNDEGLLGTFDPTNITSDPNGYTTQEIALTGSNPWVWAGDGDRTDEIYTGINTKTNNGFVIRDYTASFGGVTSNTPYFRERSSGSAGTRRFPTSYCLVTPPGVNSLSAGDSIEFTIEATIFPKQIADYYGPNENFIAALTQYGNSWEMIHREASKNKITATSSTNIIDTHYPLTVKANGNTAMVNIVGGLGYVPVVFSGLTNISNPSLWKSENGSDWELVDQSNWGKDFWQVYNDPETGLFDLVYNVNQDIANDQTASITYYLGSNPPDSTASIVVQSKVNDEPYTSNADIDAYAEDAIILAPQIKINGVTTPGDPLDWNWTGPNGFTLNDRVVRLDALAFSDIGTYNVSYNDGTHAAVATYTISGNADASIVIQSKVNDESYTNNADITTDFGSAIILAPQVKTNEPVPLEDDESWSWTGPNGFVQNGRVVRITSLEVDHLGEYTVTYDNGWYYATGAYTISSESVIENRIVHMRKRNDDGFAIDGNHGGDYLQNVYLWSSNFNNINQQWIEIYRGDGYYTYQKVGTEFCIDGNNGGADDQSIYLYKCAENNHNQHWKKVAVDGGYYRLEKRNAPAFAWDGGDPEASDGTDVYLETIDENDQSQHWIFTVLEENVKNIVMDKQIMLHPNPFSDLLTVEVENMTSANVQVINATGQKVLSLELTGENNTLDFKGLGAGVYFLKIQEDHQVYIRKIVKK